MPDRQVRFPEQAWQQVEALPDQLRWAIQRAVFFHLLEEPVPSLADPEVTRKVYRHLMRSAAAAQVESATELLTRHRRTPGDTENSDDGEDDSGAAGAPAPA